MIKRKTWKEFRESGLLWWINSMLHMFGWCIVFNYDDNKELKEVYPARCKFRGFSEKINDKGYQDISKYMKENSEELYKETLE